MLSAEHNWAHLRISPHLSPYPSLDLTPMAHKEASLPLRLMLRTTEPQVVSSCWAKACGAKTRRLRSHEDTEGAWELAHFARSSVSNNI